MSDDNEESPLGVIPSPLRTRLSGFYTACSSAYYEARAKQPDPALAEKLKNLASAGPAVDDKKYNTPVSWPRIA